MDYKPSYFKLYEAIKTKYGSQNNFAEALGFTAQQLSHRLNGRVSWGIEEVKEACRLLEIPDDRVADYFF